MHSNIEIIGQFFEAYGKRDMDGLSLVLGNDVRWIFPGRNPLSGTKNGIAEVVAFFDRMGGIMARSGVTAEVLVTGVNEDYVVECQHIWTNRADGVNLDHRWCVLWTFKDGKIIEGRHLAADQYEADRFFDQIDRFTDL